jgi:hypothetical protein
MAEGKRRLAGAARRRVARVGHRARPFACRVPGRRRARAAVALALLLGAPLCTAAGAQEPRTPDQLARHSIELLQRGDLEAAQALFTRDVFTRVETNDLLLLHHALERFTDPELRFVHRGSVRPNEEGRDEAWAYQMRDDARSILLLFKIRAPDGDARIAHVEWQPAPLDLRDRFPFALAGVPTPYYLVLGAAIAVPLLVIYALVICASRRPRMWGLWALFIALGVGELSVLWLPRPFHASYVSVEPLSIQILGVGIAKSPSYDPWRLSVSLPLGALLFLWRERRRPGDSEAVPDAPHAPRTGEPAA